MMRTWGKFIVAAVAPLMLAGCLWGPGKFTSDLALKKNGTFVLDYRGEILMQLPKDMDGSEQAMPWSESMARCYKNGEILNGPIVPVVSTDSEGKQLDGSDEGSERRACTKAELAKLKTRFEKESADRVENKRDENEKMAKMFGLPASDDASNRRFAANLMKYQGWRSVAYKGKGLFDVHYHFEGRVGQDYAFPMMPDSDIVIPFVMIRRRTDGSVMVTAPAFTGGQGPFSVRAKMMGFPDKGDGPPSRAEGRFTITTDGEILTNNSEDGPVAGTSGKQVRWDVSPASDKIPEMLVRL